MLVNVVTGVLFTNTDLIPPEIRNNIHHKCGMELFIHWQTSIIQPLKFGNDWAISLHSLLGMWLIIFRARYEIVLINWKEDQYAINFPDADLGDVSDDTSFLNNSP